MSVGTVIIECDECGASFSRGVLYGEFWYVMPNGMRFPLDRTLGWCNHCALMVAIEDFACESAKSEIRKFEGWKRDAEGKFLNRLVGSNRGRIAEFDAELALLRSKVAFLSKRTEPKCLDCGSADVVQLPHPPWPTEVGQEVPAGWRHPGCGGRMVVKALPGRLHFSYPERLYDENGVAHDPKRRSSIQAHQSKKSQSISPLSRARVELEREFGISLDRIPEPAPVEDLFHSMSEAAGLSHEANVALLYRLVAMNYLAVCKLMRDSGRNTPPQELMWLTGLLDRSVDWSESADDHYSLERVCSQLNANIESFLASFGINRG